MIRYTAPTDFRATKTPTGYDVTADGFCFAALEAVEPGLFAFRSLFADVLGVADCSPVPADRVKAFLRSLKAPYLRYDRDCFEETQADLATERAVEAFYEEGPGFSRGWAADEAARHGDA